jgi:hypothetical protein
MTSLVLLFLWLGLFLVFSTNPRHYYSVMLFFVIVGGGDIVTRLPRVFGFVQIGNLVYVQFALLSLLLISRNWIVVKTTIRNAGRSSGALALLFGLVVSINAVRGLEDAVAMAFMLMVYGNVCLAYLIAPIVYSRESDIRSLVTAIACAVLVNVVPSVYQMFTGQTFMSFYYLHTTTDYDLEVQLPAVMEGVYRLRGLFYGHASYAFAMMSAIPILIISLFMQRQADSRNGLLHRLALVAAFVQLYFSFMRGAWFDALFVIVIFYLVIVRKRLLVGLVGVIVLGTLFLMPQTTSRFEDLDYTDVGTDLQRDVTTGRALLWAQLYPAVSDGIVVGNGLGSYEKTAMNALGGQMIPSHSDYLMILLECGWLASVVYFLLLAVAGWRSVLRWRDYSSLLFGLISLVGGTMLLAHLIHGFFENLATPMVKWLPAVLMGIADYNHPVPATKDASVRFPSVECSSPELYSGS